MQPMKFLITAASAFSAIALAGPVAAAQDNDSQTTQAGLGEVVVTAERRATNLQETPLAVSAFDAGALEQLQITSSIDLVRYVPGLTGNNNTGLGSANSYFLRGLGNTESIATFDPPVGTYVDDIYVARQNANNYALFDVERIEVLRGPQGTLFGRNTTGGAIAIINRRPADEFGFFVEGAYGEDSTYLVRGTVDVPINSALLTKFSAFYTEDEGYIDNIVTGQTLGGDQAWGVRGAIRVRPTDAITWDLSADRTFQDKINLPGDGASAAFSRTPSTPWVTRTLLRERDGCEDGVIRQSIAETAATGRPQTGLCNATTTDAITSNVEFDLGAVTIDFITGWRNLEQNFSVDFFNGANNGFIIVNEGKHEQFSQEIKIAGEAFGDRLSYVAGAFYLDEDNETRIVDFTFPGTTLPFRSVTDRILDNSTESIAVFAQGDFALTEQLKLTLGLRWTREDKDIAYRAPTDVATAAGATVGGNAYRTALTQPAAIVSTASLRAAGIPTSLRTERTTPRVALEYQATDNAMVYVSYTEGFKSGGWNARETLPSRILPFSPEFAETIEAGLRTDWLDDRLRVNATMYASTVDSLQVVTGLVDPVTGAIIFLNQNAADLRVDGLEVEVQALPTENLSLFANLSLMNARFSRVLDPSGRITEGTEPVRTPDVTGNLGARWTIPTSGGGRFFAQGDVSVSGEYWVATNNAFSGLNARTEPSVLSNAAFGFESASDTWTATLECKNCTDEAYVVSWLNYYYYNEPRQVTFRLRYQY